MNVAHRRRRHAPVPEMERPQDLSDRTLPVGVREIRLSREAVHRVRPARAHRLRERRRRDLPEPRADSLCAALHRARGVEPVLSGRRHGVRFVAAFDRQCVPAVGDDAARHSWAEFNRYYDRMFDLGIVAQHEGFLLGHPAEARIRHRRDPRLRHAADRRSRRADRRVRAGAGALAVGGAADRRHARPLPDAQPQPVPGVPSRLRGHADRRARPAARRPLAEDLRETLDDARAARAGCSVRRTRLPRWSRRSSKATTPRGFGKCSPKRKRCPTSCGSQAALWAEQH